MMVDGVFHLKGSYRISRRDDHIIDPRDIPEIAVLILVGAVSYFEPPVLSRYEDELSERRRVITFFMILKAFSGSIYDNNPMA